MAAPYALISALPLARSFFDLEPLPIGDSVAIASVAGAWALALAVIGQLDLPRPWSAIRAGSGASTRA